MPLREQFFTELKASQSFNALTPQEQQELLAAYENADDATFSKALEIVRTVEAKLVEKLKLIDEKQAALAQEIKIALEQLAKAERQENEAKEKEASAAILADLEKQIDAL